MLEVRYVFHAGLRGERGLQLLRYLLDQGADEFSIRVMALHDTAAPFADAFEDELGPFEHSVAARRVVADDGAHDRTRAVRLWSFTAESLARLSSFLDDDIVHCPPGPDGWLEDLTIYRRGELVLGLVSHEREGVLRLTAPELDAIAARGIPFERTAESIRY
jgi:hypothetical protein